MSNLAPGLLLAAPPLGDPHFERRVVLLAAHNKDGAFGWVINGEELMSMAELLARAEVAPQPPAGVPGVVRAGGPVGKEQVWLLYKTEDKPDAVADQFDIGFGVSASSSRRMLEAMLHNGAPDPIVGIAGYAGWGPSQLEEEIRAGAWLPTDGDQTLLFDVDRENIWLKAYENIGTSAIAFTSKVVGSA